ncbi:VWA domain-containing protein [Acidobacteriia bacterium AH_259_A11_L15]|nr:VWA domain-containing protein [Acidobacteriia bacterium AH_259_A11_L15]
MKRLSGFFAFLGLLVAALLLSLGVPSQAQQPPIPEEEAPPVRVEVDLVNVIFSVTDRRNRQVAGLGPDDFTVYEDGVEQEIKFFTTETNLPLRIGLLVDTSNSVRPRFQFEQEAAIDFLHTILRPKHDQAFVIGFDITPVLVQDFTDDALDLADAIRSLRAGGGTALHDAIYLACKMKLGEDSSSNYRRMLIVLSDGNDTASRVTREEALEMARRHGVTIFTVSTTAPSIEYSGESRNLQNPCKVLGNEGDRVLERFAKETGGTAYCPFNTIDVGRSFERIANQLRSQYTLAYTPTNRNRDGRFRHIRIATRRRGLIVHHRPGYYALPHQQARRGASE